MSETKDIMESEVVYCYCCEDFTQHEVFDGDEEGTFYVCECGCELLEGEDKIIRPGEEIEEEEEEEEY